MARCVSIAQGLTVGSYYGTYWELKLWDTDPDWDTPLGGTNSWNGFYLGPTIDPADGCGIMPYQGVYLTTAEYENMRGSSTMKAELVVFGILMVIFAIGIGLGFRFTQQSTRYNEP